MIQFSGETFSKDQSMWYHPDGGVAQPRDMMTHKTMNEIIYFRCGFSETNLLKLKSELRILSDDTIEVYIVH